MKERLDRILTDRGIAPSRERAQALIMEGKVFVNNMPVTKAGTFVHKDSLIEVKGDDLPYVSRGGIKLAAALDHFRINLSGQKALDVGTSTGGFADCMLKRGAVQVYCVDVGYGQISLYLRSDPRIILFERTNIRYFEKDRIHDMITFSTIDVSFISLKKVLPKVSELLSDSAEILALVKPQFEVGRGEVGRGGIIRNEQKRLDAVESVREFSESLGLLTVGTFLSPLPGQKGNREYFLYLRKP